MSKDVNYYKNRYNNLLTKKKLLHSKYEKVNKYVRNGGALFHDSDDEGSSDRVYESTAPTAARDLTSVLMGLMWPSAQKSIKLKLIDSIDDTSENKNWIEMATRKIARVMDSPRSGFVQALEEHFFDQATFGTSGIFVSEDDDTIVKYKNWGIKNIVIDEGENGQVNTVYYSDKWTAKRIVETYGEQKVSKQVRDCYNSKDRVSDKFQIIQAIEPVFKKSKDGTMFATYESVHFEFENSTILKKSKFNEMPVPVSRYYKDSDNVYGKSPAMICMPAIVELNKKVQHREMIEMQEIDPSLGYDVNAFGGDVLDTTPGAINAFDVTMTGAGNPVFRLIPQINVNITDEGINRLEDKITKGFNLDRLLDFNNQQEMTATETSVRANIRGQANNSTFAREDAENFTPVIERTFNIMFRKGEFGFMPGSDEFNARQQENEELEAAGLPPKEVIEIPADIAEIMKTGEDFYQITYVTPANSLRDAESLNGLVNGVMQVANLAQVMPGVMDVIDEDMVSKKILEFNGAPLEIMRSKEAVAQIRQQRAEAQAKQQQQMEDSNDLTIAKQQKEVENGAQ